MDDAPDAAMGKPPKRAAMEGAKPADGAGHTGPPKLVPRHPPFSCSIHTGALLLTTGAAVRATRPLRCYPCRPSGQTPLK